MSLTGIHRGRCASRFSLRAIGVELAAVYERQHDADVLEYYDQPPTFLLDYRGATPRHLGVLHTADFFVIRQKTAGWEECKTHEELVHPRSAMKTVNSQSMERDGAVRPARLTPSRWVCTTEFALPVTSTGFFNGTFSSLRITFAGKLQSLRWRARS